MFEERSEVKGLHETSSPFDYRPFPLTSSRLLSIPRMSSEHEVTSAHDGSDDPYATLRARYLRAAMVIHFGEYMAMMITSYLVFHQTHSVVATGIILLCYNVPSIFLAAAAASLTRRFNAPRVDAWVNAAEGVIALAATGLATTHHLTTLALFGWVLAYGICEGLNAPNSYLVRHLIAAPGRLHELNSVYTRNVAISAVAGLLVGGALYAVAGPAWVFLICALTAIPEIVVFVQTQHRVAGKVEQPTTRSLGQAFRLLRTEPGLWAACRFAILCFFVAGYAVTLPAIASSVGSNAEILALLESGSLLGGVLVAVVVRRIHGRVRWGAVQRWCYFAAGVGLAAMAAAEFWGGSHSRVAGAVALVATVPVGFSVLLNASIVTSVIQLATPSDQRTSIFTLLALIPLVVGPISQEFVGLLADVFSVPTALGVMAFVTVVVNSAVSHRPMSVHFDALDEAERPFAVNEMLSQRSAHRGHLHHSHWSGSN